MLYYLTPEDYQQLLDYQQLVNHVKIPVDNKHNVGQYRYVKSRISY